MKTKYKLGMWKQSISSFLAHFFELKTMPNYTIKSTDIGHSLLLLQADMDVLEKAKNKQMFTVRRRNSLGFKGGLRYENII